MSERSEILEVAARGFNHPVFFAKTFLPHLFPGRVPEVHLGIWAILTRKTDWLLEYGPETCQWLVDNFIYQREGKWYRIFAWKDGKIVMAIGRNTLIMLPRGFSKTTIAGQAYNIWDICYRVHPVRVYASEAAGHAQTQLQSIKRELEENSKLHAVFGRNVPALNDPRKWTDSQIQTTTNQTLFAKGMGNQVRGLNVSGQRPSGVTFDDLEDEESVKTQDSRDNNLNWFVKDFFPILPELDPTATMTGLATLIHADAIPAHLMRLPEFTVIKFGTRDRAGKPLWPEMMDNAKIEAKKRTYTLLGRLSAYFMEYENEVKDDETAKFKASWFQFGAVDEPISNAIFLDPAISQKRKADSAVIAVVGIGQKSGRIFVQEMWGKKGATPREQVDEFFRLHKIYQCSKAGVESNGFQAALAHLMREEMFRKKHYFEIIPVTHHTKNAERIMGILQPRYAARYVYHCKHFPDLENQLLEFEPDSETKHDDWPTAVAGAVALLDPYAAHAAGDVDLGEDQYEPLESVGGVP